MKHPGIKILFSQALRLLIPSSELVAHDLRSGLSSRPEEESRENGNSTFFYRYRGGYLRMQRMAGLGLPHALAGNLGTAGPVAVGRDGDALLGHKVAARP